MFPRGTSFDDSSQNLQSLRYAHKNLAWNWCNQPHLLLIKLYVQPLFDVQYIIISSYYSMGAIPAVHILVVNVQIKIAQYRNWKLVLQT